MFKDSDITRLSAFLAHEESTALPEHSFPAYIGSGSLIIGLDASGLQGLNHGAQEAFNSWPAGGDLYVVKNGMIGNQLSEDNLLPLGYLEWSMFLDGISINATHLAQQAAVWSRDIHIDQSRVVTRMLLQNKVLLEIAAWIPFGTNDPVFEFTLTSFPYMGMPAQDHDVQFSVGLNLRTRGGKRLTNSVKIMGESLHAAYEGRESYPVAFTSLSSTGFAPSLREDWVGVNWHGHVKDCVQFTWILATDNMLTLADLPTWRDRNHASWQAYYSGLAQIEGLDLPATFLYHNSLYLLRAGFEFDKGIPIGAPFYHPDCWKASTFWDSNQVMDGLMRVGAEQQAKQFLAFLHRALRPEGKPYPWMFQYDGYSTIDDRRDFAPLVIAAHATTAIKAYEYYRDPELLSQFVYPISKAAGDYAVRDLFSLVDGTYILSSPVSNDVVEDQAVEINQTYTIAWFLTVLAKTVEYAKLLGEAAQLDPRYFQILANHQIEKNADEYLQARGLRACDTPGASWLPFLLYPTEALPFLDIDLVNQTRSRYDFKDLYMEKQGSFQPWTCFMQTVSDVRRGDGDAAYQQWRSGLDYVFGPGFFSEVGPHQQVVGLPPYISAHGAYLSAVFALFVNDSIWDKKLSIFAHLPTAFRQRSFSISNLNCYGKLHLDAQYSPQKVTASIYGNLAGFEILLPVPVALTESTMLVTVNGAPCTSWQVDYLQRIHLLLTEAAQITIVQIQTQN